MKIRYFNISGRIFYTYNSFNILTISFVLENKTKLDSFKMQHIDKFWSKYFTNVLQPTPEEITMFNLEFGDTVFEKMMRGEAL